MRIWSSAHRHGVALEDITHALRNVVRQVQQDDEMTMLLGPGRDGAFLEVGVVHRDGTTVVVHAMPARRKYLRLL